MLTKYRPCLEEFTFLNKLCNNNFESSDVIPMNNLRSMIHIAQLPLDLDIYLQSRDALLVDFTSNLNYDLLTLEIKRPKYNDTL